jgi:hypothetical protein
MLAAAVARLPPDAAEFVAEVKWDGLRACITVAGGQVRTWSRSGRDITAAYPELGVLAAVAGRRILVLDGEIVALSGPRPDFTALQRRMTAGRPGAGLLAAVPVTLIVFDVLRSGRDHLQSCGAERLRWLRRDAVFLLQARIGQGEQASPCWHDCGEERGDRPGQAFHAAPSQAVIPSRRMRFRWPS